MRQSFTVQKPTKGRDGFLYSFKPWFFKLLLESKPRAINWYIYSVKKIYEKIGKKVYFNYDQTLLLEKTFKESDFASTSFKALIISEITVRGLENIILQGVTRFHPHESPETVLKALNILADTIDRTIEQDTPKFVDDTGENVD